MSRELNNTFGLGCALHLLAALDISAHRFEDVAPPLLEALAVFEQPAIRPGCSSVSSDAGPLERARGNSELATRFLGTADHYGAPWGSTS